MREQVSYPYKTTGKITVLCILIYKFLGDKKANNSELNGSKHSPYLICFSFGLLPLFPNI
jgi:hypothetical protein